MVGPTQPTPRNQPLRQRPHPPLHPRRNHRLRKTKSPPSTTSSRRTRTSTAQPSSSTQNGDMCGAYLRCHRLPSSATSMTSIHQDPRGRRNGPRHPLLRPATPRPGRRPAKRATAVQNIVDHYFQSTVLPLGKDTVDQAFVANEILTNLIKACFDPVYGSDPLLHRRTAGNRPRDFQNTAHKSATTATTTCRRQRCSSTSPPKVSDNQGDRSILLSHLRRTNGSLPTQPTQSSAGFASSSVASSGITLVRRCHDEHWDHRSRGGDQKSSNVEPQERAELRGHLIDTGDIHGESSKVCSPCCFCRTSGRQCVRSGRPTATTTSRYKMHRGECGTSRSHRNRLRRPPAESRRVQPLAD